MRASPLARLREGDNSSLWFEGFQAGLPYQGGSARRSYSLFTRPASTPALARQALERLGGALPLRYTRIVELALRNSGITLNGCGSLFTC